MKTQRFRAAGLGLLLALAMVHPLAAGEAVPAAGERHTLWKVEGKTNSVYLLGSIHFLKPEHYPMPAPVESAYSNAQVVAFETDVKALEQVDTQMKMATKGMLPEGETLRDQLSPAVYATFAKHAQESGVPMMVFDQLRPAMAAMMLEALELVKLGFEPEYGLDKHYYDRAQKDGKETLALETVDFQISLITDFSRAEGEQLMKATLADLDKSKTQFDNMIVSWKTGDSARLERLLNDSMREAPSVCKRLLTDRNQRWVPQIEDMLQRGKNGIVIVGAGHLVGNEGVVELLRKKGLKVTQQ